MDAVKAYRYRRQKRLDARGVKQKTVRDKNGKRFYSYDCVVITPKGREDAKDVEWITTENGTHIPLKDGEAVGGPLKGEDFSDAKTTGGNAGPGNAKRRGQKDIDSSWLEDDGSVRREYLYEFNKKAEASIKEETGMSDEEVGKLHYCFLDFFGGDFEAYANGEKKEQEKTINEGLRRMGAFDGEIYRGMHFNEWQKEDFVKFRDAEVGDEIQMRTISSWTSDKKVADSFGGIKNMAQDSVVMICKNNKSGVGVQHISKFAKGESEVLAPSDAKWKVTKKRSASKYDFLKEYLESNPKYSSTYKKAWMDTMEMKKERLEQMTVIILEVEEI